MEQKKLFQIKFKSFVRLCVSIAFPFGFVFGALTLIMAFLGGNVYSNIIFVQLTGVPAGLANLIVGPIILAFIGLVIGVLSYLPFKFYLKIRKGIIIVGEWEEKISSQSTQGKGAISSDSSQ
ncbi:hypothetical protein A2483_00210 [Candidatus Peregrinibacteria bacterium RIFOXYC2_FULL_33_13]|nr:MAG: hypothetical protein UR27_C0007G0022 [Candidatus Peregrinibacteria bacterium GW2011_GWA2_33_10]KKP40916.1 MAG: hypothetical protein UR30_C0003G0088 [Candidatus Peregrinibacteria bacterium GW2011_GWC2_33_13]OGJ52428.1 MAG: hypothetical protein A2483_00210 [Candidatus Peregrinibacteria bacterium RIFOXYC2_FULL_33_13]